MLNGYSNSSPSLSKNPTNIGDLSDASKVSLKYFEVKIAVLVSIMSDPYINILPYHGGKNGGLDATSSIPR